MNIRNAILKAADHIERNPGEFRFSSIRIPSGPGCGTPGCALGWIGAFADGVIERATKARGWTTIECDGICAVAADDNWSLLGISSGEFYARMRPLVPDWKDTAYACARALRLYADKYHPAPTLPDWKAMAAQQTVPADADGNAVTA